VHKDEFDSSLSIKEEKTVSLLTVIRNIAPRLVLFMLKDNFSDFASHKVMAPARDEGLNLLAEIQYLA
jgi:hypothetical protein